MRDNILIDKTISFAARIIKLNQYLIKDKKEHIISKQIVRSGTSIGANINEANYGQSKADFISKLHIALKETAETEYWIKLLQLSEFINEEMATSLLNDCLEIKRILISSINTAKENTKQKQHPTFKQKLGAVFYRFDGKLAFWGDVVKIFVKLSSS
jgi:four helix bundle protein